MTATAVAQECGLLTPNASVWMTVPPPRAAAGTAEAGRAGAVHWQDAATGEVRAHVADVLPQLGAAAAAAAAVVPADGGRAVGPNPLATVDARGRTVQLVVTGPCYAAMTAAEPPWLPAVLAAGRVFARFTPDQKGDLVTRLQDGGRIYVGMVRDLPYGGGGDEGWTACLTHTRTRLNGKVGDGANDCVALKAAHVGVSVAAASDASIAAPFTSKEVGGWRLCARSVHMRAITLSPRRPTFAACRRCSPKGARRWPPPSSCFASWRCTR